MITKAELQQAKRVLEEIAPDKALIAELHHQFHREGDPDGEIFDKLQLVEGLYRQFLIAVDNGKD
jgi:hypothetical protein